jgi:hypothetical protein
MSTGRLGAGDTAIQPTILDAKGDLIVATAADTPARLAVGSANQVLTVDSSTATGLKWASATVAASNFTLLNTGGTTLSGSSTTISSLSGYDKFLVRWENASPNSVQSGLEIRMNADSTAGNHKYVAVYAGYASGSEFQSGNSWFLTEINSSGSAASVQFGFLLLDGCNSSGIKTMTGTVGTDGNQSFNLRRAVSGMYIGTSVISSIEFRTAYGTTFDSGTVWIYGAN